MHFDQDGTYNLVYIAEDECGNTTLAERVVEVASYRTVLYPDGTLIINEKGIDQASNEALHGGTATNVYIPFDPDGTTNVDKYIFSSYSDIPWYQQRTSVLSVEIGSVIAPTSTSYWFYGLVQCTSIDLSNIDTSATVNMKDMFYGCAVLANLDVSNFNTSNVTDMGYMFADCRVLNSLDVSGFNTSAVTDMSRMFSGCFALTSLDLSSFDTSKVTRMDGMFHSCRALTSLDLSSFNTSEVTTMSTMFSGCRELASIDTSGFDTSKVTDMDEMFYFCRAVTTLDLSSFDTSNVTDMGGMFQYDRQLTTIYASSDFVVAQVTRSNNMFIDMSTRLVGGAGTVWSASQPFDKTYAHIDGGTSDPGYFTAKA